MNILKDLLFAKGNKYLDIARFSSVLAVLTYLGLSITEVVLNRSFDHGSFGIGLAAVFGACGGWVHWRKKQEIE